MVQASFPSTLSQKKRTRTLVLHPSSPVRPSTAPTPPQQRPATASTYLFASPPVPRLATTDSVSYHRFVPPISDFHCSQLPTTSDFTSQNRTVQESVQEALRQLELNLVYIYGVIVSGGVVYNCCNL
ncbi:hypothetical protein LXL04_030812 [Taraxacum kok-saghyz]